MAETLVTLPDSLQAFVDAQVAEGGFVSASEYFCDLVRRDRERAFVRRLVFDGLGSGGGEVVNNAWFEDLRAMVRGAGPAD